MAKKQRLAMTAWNLTLEYPSIGKTFLVDILKYPKEIQEEFTKHGAKQKFGDAKSGKSPTEKYAEVQLIHAALMQGIWERTATVDMTPLILEAVSRLKKLKYDPSKGTLSDGKKTATPTEEQVKTWGSNAQVRAEIAQIRAEKAKKAADESKDELKIELK